MDLFSLAIFAAALVVAAGSPGPSIAALVARVIARGVRDVLPFLAAMWIGEAVWLTFAVLGLAVIAQTFQLAFTAIKWAGVAYLVWLAWKMWTAPAADRAADAPQPAGSGWRMFLAGMAVTLGNPKIMLFYMALLPTIIDLGRVNLLGWAGLTATMFVVLVAVDLGWAFAAGAARRLLRSARAVRLANRASAAMMAGAAAAIATRG